MSDEIDSKQSPPMLKVVNFIEEARMGGPQIRIANVASELKKHGVETIVYTAKRDSAEFCACLDKQGVAHRNFPLVRLQAGLSRQVWYLLTSPMTLFRYWRALKSDKPDVVHVNSAAQWRPAIVARLAGIPCVWHLNDTNMPSLVRQLFGRIFNRAASAFIVASSRVQSYYLKDIARERAIITIPPPTDCARFNPATVTPAEDIVSINGTKIVHVGNINPDKDILTLVRTAYHLSKMTTVPVTFVQVGEWLDGQEAYSKQVNSLITELGVTNLRFLGRRNDVDAVLAACDVFLCSSRSEASPTVVAEALAMALPIVSTDVGDVWRLNEIYEIGSVEPTESPELLAVRLSEFLQGKKPSKNSRPRDAAFENFSIERVVELHLQAYQATLGAEQ